MLAQGQVSLTAVEVIDECAHEILWFLKLAGPLLLAAYPKDLEPKRLGMPRFLSITIICNGLGK